MFQKVINNQYDVFQKKGSISGKMLCHLKLFKERIERCKISQNLTIVQILNENIPIQ